jgi:hypothetical protein
MLSLLHHRPFHCEAALNFSKALLVVHNMKIVFTYTAQLGISWRLGWGPKEKCMKQFTNHGWSYAQLTQIVQNDSSPCHIAEKREKLQSHDICGCFGGCKCAFWLDGGYSSEGMDSAVSIPAHSIGNNLTLFLRSFM